MIKGKVLIAENELITAVALREVLQHMGYGICSLAYSGEDAIKTAENEQADVVLMDERLPGETDGFEAAKEIGSRFGTATIYMTCYPDDIFKERAQVAGSSGYLVKPFNSIDVKETIDSVLEKKKQNWGEEMMD